MKKQNEYRILRATWLLSAQEIARQVTLLGVPFGGNISYYTLRRIKQENPVAHRTFLALLACGIGDALALLRGEMNAGESK